MTATQDDVLYAILSLDAYNQGYAPGINLPNKTTVNGVQLSSNSTSVFKSQDQLADFYAQAYTLNGTTIIAYRGTRFPSGPDLGDVLNGWTLSAGFADASQAQLALKFDTAVTGAPAKSSQTPPANVVLTGHSLGGGLPASCSPIAHSCLATVSAAQALTP